jgi:foldase protein PrsA
MNTLMKRGPVVLGVASLMALAIAGCGGPDGNSGPVATVNGQNIERTALYSFLEATNGEPALRQLISFELVMQELKKDNLTVSDADVTAAIEDRKKEGGPGAAQLDEVVKAGGARLEALQRSLRYQLAVDKLITKDVKVDAKALEAWFAKHKGSYGSPARAKLGLLLSSSKPRIETLEKQLKAKTKTFPQLVEEQKKAKDPVAGQSATETPQEVPTDSLPPNIKSVVAKLKAGENSSIVNLGREPQNVYAIIRIVSKEDAKSPTLEQIRAQVEMDYKLEQLARKVVAENPQNPNYDKALQQTQQFLAQQNMQQGIMQPPTEREVLRYINQTAVTKLTTQLQGAAKVETTDPLYADLVKSYGTASAEGAAGAPVAPGAAPAAGATPAAGASPAPADDHAGHNH